MGEFSIRTPSEQVAGHLPLSLARWPVGATAACLPQAPRAADFIRGQVSFPRWMTLLTFRDRLLEVGDQVLRFLQADRDPIETRV
jgi:hypothetical protein